MKVTNRLSVLVLAIFGLSIAQPSQADILKDAITVVACGPVCLAAKEAEKATRKERARLAGEFRKLGTKLAQVTKDLADTQVRIASLGTVEDFDEALEVAKQATSEVRTSIEEIKSSAADLASNASAAVAKADGTLRDHFVNDFSQRFGGYLVELSKSGKLDEYLNKDLVGDIRVFDAIMPVYGMLEHIDPTGMQQCIRTTLIKAVGTKASQGELEPKLIGTEVVAACVQEHLLEPSAEERDAVKRDAAKKERVAQTQGQVNSRKAKLSEKEREKVELLEKERSLIAAKERAERVEALREGIASDGVTLEVLTKQMEEIEKSIAAREKALDELA